MKDNKDALDVSLGYVNDEVTKKLTDHATRTINDGNRLIQIAEQWKNCEAEITQGRMFEQLEVMKFNQDSLGKGAEFHAVTTDSLGDPHAAADIFIKNDDTVVREVQAKSYGSASKSLFAQKDGKYEGMQRLIPLDQEDKARELGTIRGNSESINAADYRETTKNLTGKLNHQGTSSSGTTRQEAIDAADIKKAMEIAKENEKETILREMHYSGMEAAKISAGVSLGVSGVKNLYKYIKGDIDGQEALTDTIIDTASGAAVGYATTALSKGIGRSYAGLAKSNAHVAIAAGVVQSSKSVIKYLKGDIDSKTLFYEVSYTAVTGATSFYAAALGQLAIPIPFIGAFVGSTIGYFVGHMLYQTGLVSLGECARVQIAKERRRTVEKMCMESIARIQKHRLEAEAFLKEYFHERNVALSNAFAEMDQALMSNNHANFMQNLNKVSNVYAFNITFQTFEEFDAAMEDDDFVFKL